MAATTGAASGDSPDGGNNITKKKGIRRLLTPAIFASGDHKNKTTVADPGVSPSGTPHNRQNKTIIETAFVNNNRNHNNNIYSNSINSIGSSNNNGKSSAGNVAYMLQQQQRVHYVQDLRQPANLANDYRSRSVSPGSFNRDMNANYGIGGRRADSACSLSSTASSAAVGPAYSAAVSPSSSSSLSGRRSTPIIPYSQYYNNRNGISDGGTGQQQKQQQQRMLLMPVGAQVKICKPPSPSLSSTSYAGTAMQQHANVIYGNVATSATDHYGSPFVRGSPHRATIGCVRESPSRQSTIYETEEDVANGSGGGSGDGDGGGQKRFQPIFKRGALQASVGPATEDPAPASASPKRVSFSPQPGTGNSPSEQPVYWPTKKGPSPQPPTRCRAADPSTAVDRPLPPVPKRSPSTSAIYGTLRGVNGQQQHRQYQQQRWWPPPPPQQQHCQQSGSESGSEAGEVQRILNARNGHPSAGKCLTVVSDHGVIYCFLNTLPAPRYSTRFRNKSTR